MMNRFTSPIRTMLLALALVFAVQTADARGSGNSPQTVATTRTTARSEYGTAATNSDATPVGGILIIAGIVGGLILLAWIASRVGDNRTDTVA